MDGIAGSAGSPQDRPMEARVAVLEEIAATTKQATIEFRQYIRALRNAQERDFRILFSALITTAIGLAAMMAKGFHWS